MVQNKTISLKALLGDFPLSPVFEMPSADVPHVVAQGNKLAHTPSGRRANKTLSQHCIFVAITDAYGFS